MSDPHIYFEDVAGGSHTVDDKHARMTFLKGGRTLDIVMPLNVLPKLGALALQLANPPNLCPGDYAPFVGFAPESVEVEQAADGFAVVSFGVGDGEIPFVLDSGQIAELKILLQSL